MEPLKLNKLHQKQLTSMCKKLFNYSYIQVEDFFGNGTYLISFGYQDRHNIEIVFHWYEFVNNHLAEKIFNPNPKHPPRELRSMISKFFLNNHLYAKDIEGIHPVEYLYEQFKKLQ